SSPGSSDRPPPPKARATAARRAPAPPLGTGRTSPRRSCSSDAPPNRLEQPRLVEQSDRAALGCNYAASELGRGSRERRRDGRETLAGDVVNLIDLISRERPRLGIVPNDNETRVVLRRLLVRPRDAEKQLEPNAQVQFAPDVHDAGEEPSPVRDAVRRSRSR